MRGFVVERLVLAFAEYVWEIVGNEATEHQIGVSDRQRTILATTTTTTATKQLN